MEDFRCKAEEAYIQNTIIGKEAINEALDMDSIYKIAVKIKLEKVYCKIILTQDCIDEINNLAIISPSILDEPIDRNVSWSKRYYYINHILKSRLDFALNDIFRFKTMLETPQISIKNLYLYQSWKNWFENVVAKTVINVKAFKEFSKIKFPFPREIMTIIGKYVYCINYIDIKKTARELDSIEQTNFVELIQKTKSKEDVYDSTFPTYYKKFYQTPDDIYDQIDIFLYPVTFEQRLASEFGFAVDRILPTVNFEKYKKFINKLKNFNLVPPTTRLDTCNCQLCEMFAYHL